MNILSFLSCLLLTWGCQSAVPPSLRLVRENIEPLLKNPQDSKQFLLPGTYKGCEQRPVEDPTSSRPGVEVTGKPCHLKWKQNGKAFLNFLSEEVQMVAFKNTDIYIGELKNKELLIVQYSRAGKALHATHTAYDSRGHVIYGLSGEKTFTPSFKSCGSLSFSDPVCKKMKFYP